MRILQINKFLYRRGGAEIHMLDLCELLKKHGHEVIHFSTSDPQNEFSPHSQYFIPSIDLRMAGGFLNQIKTFGHILYSTLAAKKIEKLIKETKPDIAHLHNIYRHLSPSILRVLKKYKIPTVMTLHDYKLICPNYKLFTEGQICERCKGGKYLNAAKHKCVFNKTAYSLAAALEMSLHKFWKIYEKNTDIFISPSEFLKNKFIEFGQDSSKIKILPNFLFKKGGTNETKLEESTVNSYLLYFGRISEEKGLMTLLEAAKLMPEISIRIVGNGPQKSDLFNKITMERLANIKLLDYKTGAELEKEILGARAVILPSVWYENYPLSVLEALGYGKLVIASRLGGLPEIIKDKETGFLFNPGDAADLARVVKDIWNDETKIKKMNEKAQQQVQELNNPEKYYEELMKIYKKLCPVC